MNHLARFIYFVNCAVHVGFVAIKQMAKTAPRFPALGRHWTPPGKALQGVYGFFETVEPPGRG
jgi:hypothetical protein